MVIKCLECNYKCGNIACLKYHYESWHKDKIDKCICGNITISAICATDFSPWGCYLKNESSSGSGSNSSSSSSSNSSSDSGSSSSSSSSSGSDSSYNSSSNSDPNPNSISVPNLNPNPNPNPNYNSEVLIRNCNKCNYIKPLTDFDESKYTCRKCTSTKVNCPYCASVVRYDGIRAHVKKQHPNVELTKEFSRNLRSSLVSHEQSSFTDLTERLVKPLHVSTELVGEPRPKALPRYNNNTQTEEICSCKYYNFVSFLINNGINIEKVKENINLLKSIDNLK